MIICELIYKRADGSYRHCVVIEHDIESAKRRAWLMSKFEAWKTCEGHKLGDTRHTRTVRVVSMDPELV